MNRKRMTLLVLAIILTLVATGAAQVITGVPPFQSFGGGPDVINLGNMNVHYSMPVFSRAGRGIPFSYALAYDSSIYVNSGGIAWVPASSWGLTRDISAATGYVYYRHSQGHCHDSNGAEVYNVYWFDGYIDAAGTSHPIVEKAVNDNSNGCGPTYHPSDSAVTTDGSGMTLSFDSTPSASVTFRSGEKISPPISSSGAPTGTGTQIDANGNQITSSIVSGVTNFYDTLSSTTPVMKISGTAPSPVSYTYTNPSNANAAVVVTYVTKTVQTNFLCSGISEYGPLANALPDKITLPDGSYYQFTYETTPGFPANVTGRLASLRLPTGGTISYTYQGGDTGKGIMCSDGSTSGFDRTTPDGTWQYRRTGASPNYTTTITTPVDPATGQSNQTVITFQGNYETLRQVYQGSASGTPLAAITTCYNGTATTPCPGTAVASPFSQITVKTSLNGGSQNRVDSVYNGYGLITEKDEYDFGGTSPIRKTATTYASLTNNIFDHPASVTVTDGSGNLRAKTSYGYDQSAVTTTSGTPNHISVTGSRGNVTTITNYVTSSATLSKTVTYYDTGTPNTSADVNGALTTYSYAGTSCGNSFVTSISEPLSLSRSSTWNCTGGVQTSATDENSKITSTQYTDPAFWRPVSVSYPDGGQTSITYNTVATPWNIQVSSKIDNTRSLTSKTVLDGLGRTVQAQLTSDPVSTIYSDTTYDSLGRVASVSNPYRSGADPTYGLTSYQYDALGRVIKTTQADGATILQSYSNRATQVQTEGNGTARVTKIYQSDGLGRLTSTCEVTSVTQIGISPTPSACGQDIAATGFLTSYQYDTLSNLTGATQGGLNPRTYAFDQLSRMSSETNPESGQTTYTYDSCSAGDLCQRVAPKPNQTSPSTTVTTSYAYDALHRLTSKTYNDGVTNSANFVYDLSTFWGVTVSNPKAHMIAETSGAGLFGNIYSYDSMGRRQNTWQVPPIIAGSGSYPVNYTYDLLGDITSLYNSFEGKTYSYSYDTAARLTKLQSTFSDANHPGTLLTVNQYNPLGELQQATLGNGIVRNLQFDKRGRVTSLTDGSVYSFTLGFAPDSNILTGNDPVNGNWTYTYDDFSRLSTSSKSGQAFNYKFDRFGNRWQQNATVGGGPQPQYMFDANNHIVGNSYDAAGNMTNDGTASYQYDPEHRLISVSPLSGAAASYTYDASGRRVQSTVGTSTVDYLYDQAGRAITELSSASWIWSELYAGGQHVATYSGGTTTFDHSDWLGTVRAHSNVSGASAETCTSLPFGDGQTCTSPDWSLLHFTGQLRDSESNLDHFMFRQYSSTQGRWMMPDPAGMAAVDPSNPQTWNRYAYVGNDPLSRVDPLGLDFADCYMCQAFSAENRNIDLSADAQTRAFFGDKYSDLPGKSNPILQGLRDYITDLDGPKDFIGEFQLSNEELGIVAANNGFTWAWNFTKSLFGGFTIDTGSGSCIGVALDSAQPVLSAAKKVQDYSKQYAAPIVASLPGNGASLSSGMYAMANYAGQMKASPGDVALFTAGAGAINVAASNLSAWGATALAKTPTTLAIAGDAALAYGVYQEAKAALSGKCH